MKLSTVISLGMMASGGLAAARVVMQRQPTRAQDKTISVVVDYDDAQAVSIRAGLSFADLLTKLKASGATHITLPELTLNRLWRMGQLFSSVPHEPLTTRAPFGQWIYLTSADAACVARLATELQTRLPQLAAQVLSHDKHTLALAGDLPTIDAIGLGFDAHTANAIHQAGLGVVPRPVSYDWHEPALIHRTIAQAARVGDGIIAFEGKLILGHEMHLNVTLEALQQYDLTFAYFAESRHQRGDWFIAKRRMPRVVIAHQFTPVQMIPEDYHSIAHRWANLARERGVRMMLVNFFRVVHATEPLECLKYLEHIRGAVGHEGFTLGQIPTPQSPMPNPESQIANHPSPIAMGLVPVGAGTLVARQLLGLNDGATLALALAGAMGAALIVPRLDRARDELEQQYAPTYASKILALSTAIAAPLASVALARECDSELEALPLEALLSASSATAFAALTSSDEYRMRVEEYKGFDLDVWLPLVGVMLMRRALTWTELVRLLVGSLIGWQLTRRFVSDPLARFDSAPAESHTHHLSAAMRMVGDALLALGPRPIRKWGGLAPFGLALSIAAKRRGFNTLHIVASLISAVGHAALLTGFRKPERDPLLTARDVRKSWMVGAVVGFILAKLIAGCRQRSSALALQTID
jgi:hypothetical protein